MPLPGQNDLSARVVRTARRWRRRMEPRIAVLMYHRVADVPCDPWDQCVTQEHFDEQLTLLKREVDILSLDEVSDEQARGTLPSRAAVITFDDGYADNLYCARPLLESHGLPATFFLTTGALVRNREFWWDELERIFLYPGTLPEKLELTVSDRRWVWSLKGEASYSEVSWEEHRTWRAPSAPETMRQRVYFAVWDLLRPLAAAARQAVLTELADWAGTSREPRPTHRVLSEAEAKLLAAGRRIELGAHSVSHAALPQQPGAVQIEEIRASKTAIESLTGVPVRHFAYPYGDCSAQTALAVREAGFLAALTTSEGLIDLRRSKWQWPRCKVYNWSGGELSRRLSAVYNSV